MCQSDIKGIVHCALTPKGNADVQGNSALSTNAQRKYGHQGNSALSTNAQRKRDHKKE